MGAILDWRELAAAAALGPAMLFAAMFCVPETPSYLLFSGREMEARGALRWLRGGGANNNNRRRNGVQEDGDDSSVISMEIANLKENLQGRERWSCWLLAGGGRGRHHHGDDNINSRRRSLFPWRPLLITCGLMFFQKFSGVTVMNHYAVPIFMQVCLIFFFFCFHGNLNFF